MTVIELFQKLLRFKSLTPDDDGAFDFIEEYLGDEWTFIKLDVEGHEPQVLEGAKKVITKNLPTILVELIDYKNSIVPQILKEFGYTEEPIRRPEKMYLFRSPLQY